MSEGKLKKRYVLGTEIYWIHECCPDKRFTEAEAESLANEENFVPASVLDEAKKDYPGVLKIITREGVNYTMPDKWFKKWFGET